MSYQPHKLIWVSHVRTAVLPFSLVLQQYCKLNEQMDERQYYSALKTLEQLEHTFLPRVRGYVSRGRGGGGTRKRLQLSVAVMSTLV